MSDQPNNHAALLSLYREMLANAPGGRMKCVQPLLWQWTNEAMPLRLLTSDNEFRLGNPISSFQIANAARRAAEANCLYPIYLLGDGKPSLSSYSDDDANAWLRGENSK